MYFKPYLNNRLVFIIVYFNYLTLNRVSSECERVYSKARVVYELVAGLTGSGPSSLSSVFQGFLESQAKLLAVQTNTLAVQSAPPLVPFTGEDVEVETNSFERWLERFEERAVMLSWTDEHKCYHIKQHLGKTALQLFQLLPTEVRSNYSDIVAAFKDGFKPVDIEELRELEFHQLMQKEQSVKKLRLQLITLGKKAFPTLGTKELDRLLKGKFFQALLPKWQRKLGAPNLGDSFNALYERARTCEQHDQQYRSTRDSHDPIGKQ